MPLPPPPQKKKKKNSALDILNIGRDHIVF